MFQTKKLLLSTLASVCLVFTLALGVASAHVGVNPREVPPDTSQVFTVRVPNEKEEPTVRVRVEFPTGLAVSRFQPKPGWTYELEKDSAGKVVGITWSGGKIGPNEYDEFAFIARTPKEAGTLAFKAYQTYQSGEIAEWVGPKDSQRPAALVEVKPVPAAGASASGAPSIENAGQPASAASQSPAGARSEPALPSLLAFGWPAWLSVAALVAALGALALSGASAARRRA